MGYCEVVQVVEVCCVFGFVEVLGQCVVEWLKGQWDEGVKVVCLVLQFVEVVYVVEVFFQCFDVFVEYCCVCLYFQFVGFVVDLQLFFGFYFVFGDLFLYLVGKNFGIVVWYGVQVCCLQFGQYFLCGFFVDFGEVFDFCCCECFDLQVWVCFVQFLYYCWVVFLFVIGMVFIVYVQFGDVGQVVVVYLCDYFVGVVVLGLFFIFVGGEGVEGVVYVVDVGKFQLYGVDKKYFVVV